MAETLKDRVQRVIAGGLHALLDKIEDAAPEVDPATLFFNFQRLPSSWSDGSHRHEKFVAPSAT